MAGLFLWNTPSTQLAPLNPPLSGHFPQNRACILKIRARFRELRARFGELRARFGA
jgi:hypothetical protein